MRSLPIGGSTITALDLAASMQAAGHDVTVVAGDGPAASIAEDLGVRTVTSSGGAPSFAATLRRELRSNRPDVVHAWDWQAVAATHAVASVGERLPMIGSITLIDPPPFLPEGVPIGFVSELMRRRDPRHGGPNFCQNMPINTDTDRREIVDSTEIVARMDIPPGRRHAVLVTRMAHYMKLESILFAIEALDHISELPLDLLIVGGGEAYDEVEAAAREMNRRLGTTRVRLTGELIDPRPAYALADVVIGMGSSILRGMAFGTPAIVVGEDGFSLTVTPDNVEAINDVGFYGLGDGVDTGAKRLAGEIAGLIEDSSMADELGRFNRDYVVAHHDTGIVAGSLLDQLSGALETGPARSARSVAHNATSLAAAVCRKAAERMRTTPDDPHRNKPQEYRELT